MPNIPIDPRELADGLPIRPTNPMLAQQYAADLQAAAQGITPRVESPWAGGGRPTNPMLTQQRAHQMAQARAALMAKYGMGGGEAAPQTEAMPEPPPQPEPVTVMQILRRMLGARYGATR